MKKKEILKEQKKLKAFKNERAFDFSEKDDIKTGIYVTLGVLLFIGVTFVLINIFNGTWDLFSRKNDEPVAVDSSLLMCGTLFKPEDEEYLVLAYNVNNEDDSLYSVLFDNYNGDLELYRLDLESGFNKGCIAEKNNLVNDVTKLKFASHTLLHIKDGKIYKTYTTKEKIKDKLMEE